MKCKGCGLYIEEGISLCSDCMDEGCMLGFDGSVSWYTSDWVLHRVGGPAVEHVDGSKEWYIIGVRYTEAEYEIINIG